MYHYVYAITYTDEPNIYYGVRSCKCCPEKDNYWGSPKTFKVWMEAHKATRVKTILSIYPTRDEAHLIEDKLIERQWEIDKPLSLNGSLGHGSKFNTLGVKRKKEAIQAGVQARSKRYYLISPKGCILEGRNIKDFCHDNKLDHGAINKVINGNNLHHKGWTASKESHLLYLEYYENRGIKWSNKDKRWVVRWHHNKNNKEKSFKNRTDAILFRDSLFIEGCEWEVRSMGWKERLADNRLVA